MSAAFSDDEIERMCQDLAYQVAYAFYDGIYILLLKLVMHRSPVRESELGDRTMLPTQDLRRYLGHLHVHRLIKRHVNKEKQAIPEWAKKKEGGGEKFRTKDVAYWYIDYREMANVVKYRIAMMRKAVEEKLNSEVGQRGYICPADGTKYSELDAGSLFDPSTGVFRCEMCATELIHHEPDDSDPAAAAGGGDKLQRFNIATAPIRDALRRVEGVTLPSINIMAWLANNVGQSYMDDGDKDSSQADDKQKKITVVVGGEGERERIERERLAEQQRVQNALPAWYTHSTVTGTATALGISAAAKEAARTAAQTGKQSLKKEEDDEDALAAHYAQFETPSSPSAGVKAEEVVIKEDPEVMVKAEPSLSKYEAPVKQESGAEGGRSVDEMAVGVGGGYGVTAVNRRTVDDESDEEEMEGSEAGTNGATAGARSGNDGSVMIMVAGVPKPLEDITDEDQEAMTPEEYQAYYDAALAA